MNDYSFIIMRITSDSHVILECDERARRLFSGCTEGSLDEHIAEQYKENFAEKVNLADDAWFPARIIIGKETPLFYIRSSRDKNDDSLKLVLVSLDELLDTHDEMIKMLSSYRAQLDLYEDVFFEFDPDACVINVFNTDIAKFDAQLYAIDEFENILCTGIPEDSQKAVREFINQMKTKAGRISTWVNSNILNDDQTFNASVMEAAYVFYQKGSEGVVGHIRIGNSEGGIEPSIIKHDSLTGLVDKENIEKIARDRIDVRELEGTTLAIVDIDFFKNVNDTYGHQFGDTVIKKVADIIEEEVGDNGIVGRFGGDEFLLIFFIDNEGYLRDCLRNIKRAVGESFPDRGPDGISPLTLSVGTATFSRDADNYNDLFMLADYCLYIAKEKGRNRYIIYTPEKHGPLEEILEKSMTSKKFNDRGEMSYGDMLINMFDAVIHGPGTSLENLMDEFADSFDIQCVQLYVGKPFKFRYLAGTNANKDDSSKEMLEGFFNSSAKDIYMAGRKFIVVNRIDHMPPQAEAFKVHLKNIGVYSFMFICFNDKDENECILLISSIGKYTQWNEMHYKYYRAFGDVLSCFRFKT